MNRYGIEAQSKIYTGGRATAFPILGDDWRAQARQKLADGPWWYLEGGAGAGDTMKSNRRALERWTLRPRMLRDVDTRDFSVKLFGNTHPLPVLFAPVGVLSILHPDAELAAGRAAARFNVPFVLSTVSSFPMEHVAKEMNDSNRWFQLYPSRDPAINTSMIRRAEAAGYSALVVTVDTTMLGWREHDLENAYLPFLQGQGLANYLSDSAFRNRLQAPLEANPAAAIQEFLSVYVNPKFTWADLADIRKQTKLPLLVKGITHPDDVLEAKRIGVDAVIVSNHGGRQVDGAISALDALVEIRKVVGTDYPLLMDSGIRRAADVLKAVALGASAVLIGRPYAYALAVGGEAGIVEWMSQFLAELDLEMALAGYASISELNPACVTRVE